MIARLRQRIQPAELTAVGWAWLFFYSILSGYFVIRPIRDDMAVAGGVQNLPWLFTATLCGVSLAHPLFGLLTSRVRRERVAPLAYHFFALNLVIFFCLFHLIPESATIWAGRVFFVWVAVFNLFLISIFWSTMTDTFSTEQGTRLFGLIGAGGTIGSVTGAALTSSLVGVIGPANLLLLSAVLIEVAAFSATRVLRLSRGQGMVGRDAEPETVGGRALDGLRHTLSSRYLGAIALQILLFTVFSTFIYFQQAAIVDAAIPDRVERTRFFANIDLAVNLVGLVTQSLATGILMRVFGLTPALAFLPVLCVAGFGILAVMPSVGVLVAFQVLRRSSEFAIARPAREVLFTSAARADRYKAKNFMDTFVYRTGDQVGAWMYAGLLALGLGIFGISLVGAALSAISVGVAVWLGRHQPPVTR